MLLLPDPLGPTTPVMPGPNSRVVRSAKVLKPNSSRDFRYKADDGSLSRPPAYAVRIAALSKAPPAEGTATVGHPGVAVSTSISRP